MSQNCIGKQQKHRLFAEYMGRMLLCSSYLHEILKIFFLFLKTL